MSESDGLMLHDRKAWEQAIRKKGHEPKMHYDGTLDIFAHEHENHNGPGCTKCHWSVCWHCHPDPGDIPTCSAMKRARS